MSRVIRQILVASLWSTLLLSSAAAQTLTPVLLSKKALSLPSFEPTIVGRGQTVLHDQLCVLDPNMPTLGITKGSSKMSSTRHSLVDGSFTPQRRRDGLPFASE